MKTRLEHLNREVKTSELTGKALRFAVAKAEGWIEKLGEREVMLMIECDDFAYDTDWGVGGPIIEHEGIYLRAIRKQGHALNGVWLAAPSDSNTGSMVQWVKRPEWKGHYFVGPTPLIAAMRVFVASRLGDKVEIPEELR